MNRAPIDLLRRRVSRTKGLGRAVHQMGPRSSAAAAAALENLDGMTAGIGDVAQVLAHGTRPFELRQLNPERRDGGQAGDALPHHGIQHIHRQNG
jgi:hypothetical protein